MSYNAGIPNATDYLSDSQQNIKDNFSSANTIFGNNHYAFNAASNNGKHKEIEMVNQADPTGLDLEGIIYTKKDAQATPQSQMYYVSDGNSSDIYQLTNAIHDNYSTFSTNGEYQVGPPSLYGGWTFLPGGLILQYGYNSVEASTSTFTYNFPFAFPNTVFNIQMTPFRAASSPGSTVQQWLVSGWSLSQFQIYNNGSHSFSFNWMAIGN